MRQFKKRIAGNGQTLFSGKFIYRVVATSTTILFLLILVVFFIIYHFFLNQVESETRSYIVSTLEQADSTLATMFNGLQSEGELILSSDSVTNMLVDRWNADPNFSYETVEQMKRLCHVSDLANEISLYLIKDDIVLTSQSNCSSLANCPTEEQSIFGSERPGIIAQNGSLYLLLQYPQQEPMARMLIQLNQSLPRRALLNETSSIYVFDSNLQPLFSSMHYPIDLQVTKITQKSPQVLSCYTDKGDCLVAYQSGITQLIYLYRSKLYTSQQARSSSLHQLLPVALFLLLGAAAYSYGLFRWICSPIQRMLNLILHSTSTVKCSNKRDLEVLVQTLSTSLDDLAQRDRSATEAIASVAPQLLEHLFRRILFEGLQNPKVIEHELHSIPDIFPQKSPYVIVCIALWYPGNKNIKNDLLQIHLLYLQELSRRYWNDICPVVSLLDSENRIVLVISCQENNSQQLQSLFESFLKMLENSAKSLAFRPVAGRSEALTGLSQMADLYAEAVQMLNHALYELNSSRGQTAPTVTAPPSWRRYLRDAQDFALKGQQHEAEEACSQLVEALHNANELDAALMEVHEVFCRRIELVTGSPAMLPSVIQSDDIKHFLNQAIHLLIQNSRECQMDYLESAQNCIAQCYADSSLSLDEVSRRIGISGPYLSSLFASLTEEHFLDYLNHYRIERACELLKNSNLSIAEIGFRVGFNSSSSFIRVFKKYHQVPPGSYRAGKSK